ncbi:protein of unknown function [Actinopolymorpha cephalotaxi]|uniref:DUF1206 domain-containing protein n=1 Tax=Actinopolymorpha cephalotaxi TaxID=504797 RepID=A0A1I2YHE4_9ACTN|nr:DUF1206 domain-containing protein [Actinopolymorpha cephalotaxi]NYH87014.1 hypothetical protein [Actinopolymorpha cephalotaxi]SFH23981.1 protein of unknown function [Actinopolymorpha cephalotaxi]
MNAQVRSSENAGRQAQQAAGSKPVRMLGRVGLAAYGLVNLLFAYLMAKVAFSGGGGGNASKQGALQTIASQPGGGVLLWVITIGLVALAVWQLTEAGVGYGYAESDKRRTFRRLGSAGKAIAFGALAFSAGKMAAGGGSGGSGGKQKTITAKVLELPGGQILVGLVGLGIIAGAGYLVYRGWKKKFLEDLNFARASQGTRKATIRLGQVGFMAVGVAYALVGVLVLAAAVTYDPKKSTGLDGALQALAKQPYGPVLLGLIALGVACYGVYCFFDARFRRG